MNGFVRQAAGAGLAAALGLGTASDGGLATAGPSGPGNRSPAAVEAARLVDVLVLPAGSVRLNAAPLPELGGAAGGPVSPDLVTVTRWYRVPVRPSSFVTGLEHRPPEGLTRSVEGGSSGRDRVTVDSRSFVDDGPPASPLYTGGTLTLSVAQTGGSTSDVRVDGQAVALAPRRGSGVVPLGVASIALDAQDGSLPPRSLRRVTIAGAKARAVAAALDALTVTVKGTYSCPAAAVAPTLTAIVAVIALPAGRLTFTVAETGCRFVAVTLNGADLPGLNSSPAIDMLLGKDLVQPPCDWHPAGQPPSRSRTSCA